ncbi:MAG: 5'/3'-nucleotidase SurE [Methanobacteriaceae archaeon]
MKILLTNDDGVNSTGILASYEAIKSLDFLNENDIKIVAPSNQQSGIGRALTLFEPVRVTETYLKNGTKAYAVSGTPTDSTTIGIFEIMDKDVDLVVSGINIGENLGKAELSTSGTIGAAMEAASHGIPAIAISIQVDEDEIKFEEGHIGVFEIDFKLAKKVLGELARKVLEKGMPKGVDLLNINIPASPQSEELTVARLGKRMYTPHIQKRMDPRGKPYYWIDGTPHNNDNEGSDVHTLKVLKKPTITPIAIDSTGNLDSLKYW